MRQPTASSPQPESQHHDADVLVLGAGIIGVSVALHLQKRGKSVLLIDRRADATLPDGRKLGLDGFQVIDTERFANLDEAVVLDWHRRGWLALVHFHLASLERFGALLTLQAQAAATAEPATKPTKSKKA